MSAVPEPQTGSMAAEHWLDANNRYLAASLHWLRLRLQALLADTAGQEPASSSRSWFGRPLGFVQTGKAVARPSKIEAVARAAEARAAADQSDPQPALLLLAQRLGLSAFERDTLLLCAAPEFDPALPGLIGAVQGGGRSSPTFGLALQLFEDPAWDALSPHRPLRYARLLDVNQPGATPLTAAALRADERIVNYLKGLNELDDRLVALLAPDAQDSAPRLAPTQKAIAAEVLRLLRLAAQEARPPLVALVGADAGSKLAVAQYCCATLGRHLYRMSLEGLPTLKAEIENLARLWHRESLFLPIALYLDVENLDSASVDVSAAFRWFVSRDAGVVFAGLRELPARGHLPGRAVEVDKPSAQEQHATWVAALRANGVGEVQAETGAGGLAGQFNLNLHDIHQAFKFAADGAGDASVLPARAWDVCRGLTRPRLDTLAQRIDPRAQWEDLVLGDEATGLLRQIVGQVRERYRVYEEWGYARKLSRGLGINALFAGESGTGKTMAAEVLANELRLALYRIDLSAVVSKYIGETEKNLRRLFDAAEAGGAILLFDEADALFGKRSEVKDSHDRYANIEINYLLQRMEAFSGLAILATNMKSALDTAFLRRLRFIVNFQYPGLAERRSLWQKAFPAGVPCEALDFERLARFNLSGGNVTSIAVNATFAAARRGTPLTMPLLLAAVRTELRKLDRPVNESEFR